MNKTAISWTKYTNNPIRFRRREDGRVGWHCEKLSDGCKFCYAETLNMKWGTQVKFTHAGTDEMEAFFDAKMIAKLYTLKDETAMVFMFDMTDIFGDFIPDHFRAAAFCVMLDLPQYTFQLLTKRAAATVDWHERFVKAVQSPEFLELVTTIQNLKPMPGKHQVLNALERGRRGDFASPWAAHIWQGVSVEDARVLHRIESLRQSKAHVRFISAEPLLGAWGDDVDLSGIHWVIVGGESGKHMTPGHPRWMNMEHARQIKRLCVNQGVAFFYKQDSGHVTELRPYLVETDGSKWEWQQYPGDLRPPKPYGSTKAIDDIEGKSLEECLRRARQFEQLAYGYPLWPWWSENVALAAAYWYEAAEKLRPQRPTPTLYAGYECGEFPDYEWGSAPRQAFVKVSPTPEPAPNAAPASEAKQGATRVVNFRDVKEHWDQSARRWDDEQFVYIGRESLFYGLPPSPFANPFKIDSDTAENRAEAIAKYREWITKQPAFKTLETLRGKTLVCWCRPQKACHGDVLLELLGEASQPVEQTQESKPEAAAPAQLSLFDVETEKTLHKSPIFY